MNTRDFRGLCHHIRNLKEIINAPVSMGVEVRHLSALNDDGTFDNSCRVYRMTAGELKEAIKNCKWDDGFGGWLFVWPGEEKRNNGYQGIYAGDDCYYVAEIREPDYQV